MNKVAEYFCTIRVKDALETVFLRKQKTDLFNALKGIGEKKEKIYVSRTRINMSYYVILLITL